MGRNPKKRKNYNESDPDGDNDSELGDMIADDGNDMFLISGEVVKFIVDKLNQQMESINKSKAGADVKKSSDNCFKAIKGKLNRLSLKNDNHLITGNNETSISTLIKEVNNLKKVVLKQDDKINRSIYRNHERTCIMESGQLSFADAVKSIKERANLDEDKIRINSIFQSKTGKIVIKCKDKLDQEKLVKNCESANLPVRKMKDKQTRLMINGLPVSLNELIAANGDGSLNYDPLLNVLVNRHSNSDAVKAGLSVNKVFNAKNDTMSVILNADEKTVELLKADPVVYVGVRSFKLVSYIYVKQCFKCYELGDHLAIDCKKSGPNCGKCSDLHDTKSCTNETSKKCTLCTKSTVHANGANTHGARDGHCPVKQLYIKNKIKEIWI